MRTAERWCCVEWGLNSGARDGLVFSGNNGLYFYFVTRPEFQIQSQITQIKGFQHAQHVLLHTVCYISIQSVSISI